MERERRLLSCLRREGLGEPEELLELELREELELPERLDAEEELEPLLEPLLVLEPELELELERDLRWGMRVTRQQAGAAPPPDPRGGHIGRLHACCSPDRGRRPLPKWLVAGKGAQALSAC